MTSGMATNALALVSAALLARSLGPAGMGLYQGAVRWLAIGVTFIGLSLGQASAYLLSKPGATMGPFIRNAFIATVAQTAVLLGLFAALGPVVFADHPDVAEKGAVFLLAIPVMLMADYLGHLTRSQLEMRPYVLARVAQTGAFALGAAIIFIAKVDSLTAVGIAFVASTVLGLVVLVVCVHRQGWIAGGVDLSLLRRTLGYALRLHPGVEARELNLYLDQLMMSVMLPLEVLGLYASAVSAASVLRLGSSAFLLLAQAEVQKAGLDGRHLVVGRLARLNLIFMVPAALVLVVLLPSLLPAIYGSAFSPAVPMAQVLCLAVVVEGFGVSMAGVLVGTGQAVKATVAQVMSLVVSFVALLIWLPSGQGMAAAWISVMSYSVAAMGSTWLVIRAEHMQLREMFLPHPSDFAAVGRLLQARGRA